MARHGSCLCGKTTFTLDEENPAIAICHCTHCQKQTGSAFSLNALAPGSKFHVQGNMRKFGDVGDSGNPVTRWFCPDCGSPVLTEAAALPETAIIKAGLFDDTSWIKPGLQIYCDSRQNWAPLVEGAETFGKMPG